MCLTPARLWSCTAVALSETYVDAPMDFADAALVLLAEARDAVDLLAGVCSNHVAPTEIVSAP